VTIYKVLVLSVVHVDPDFYASILKEFDEGKCYLGVSKNDYSITLYVPDKRVWMSPDEETFLIPLFEKARKLNCVWVVIDQDGEVYPDLPSFVTRWDAKEKIV
jgi:hypothetical protein